MNIIMEKLRAAVLSDGNLGLSGGKAHFRLNLSDNKGNLVQRELIPIGDLLGFLQRFVVEVLRPLGIEPCNGHPKIVRDITKSKDGEWLPGVRLYTQNSEVLMKLYHECYPGGKKTVPDSFIITDVFLAWYFMFDGCSGWCSSGGPGVDVSLCTHGFSLHSIELFERQLSSLGIRTGRKCKSMIGESAGIAITIPREFTNLFTGIIDPYVIPPYRYKVKYRGGCPPELAEEYRRNRKAHCNEYMREYRRRKGEASETHPFFDNLRRSLS